MPHRSINLHMHIQAVVGNHMNTHIVSVKMQASYPQTSQGLDAAQMLDDRLPVQELFEARRQKPPDSPIADSSTQGQVPSEG